MTEDWDPNVYPDGASSGTEGYPFDPESSRNVCLGFILPEGDSEGSKTPLLSRTSFERTLPPGKGPLVEEERRDPCLLRTGQTCRDYTGTHKFDFETRNWVSGSDKQNV